MHCKEGFVTLTTILVIWEAVPLGDVVLTTCCHTVVLVQRSGHSTQNLYSAISCMGSPSWCSDFVYVVHHHNYKTVFISHKGILNLFLYSWCFVAHFIASIFMTTGDIYTGSWPQRRWKAHKHNHLYMLQNILIRLCCVCYVHGIYKESVCTSE